MGRIGVHLSEISVISVMVASLALSGCSGMARNMGWVMPITRDAGLEDTRRKIRTVAVVSAAFTPDPLHRIVVKTASAGAAQGATESILRGGPMGVLLLPVMVPLGAAIGGRTTLSEEEARKLLADLEPAMMDKNIQDKLAAQVAQYCTTALGSPARLELGKGPRQVDDSPDYRPMSKENIDLVVEANVVYIGFRGSALQDDPLVYITVLAEVRAVQPVDGKVLYSGSYDYQSTVRTITEWKRENDSVRKELASALSSISERFVDDLFFGYRLAQKYDADVVISDDSYCALRPYEPALPAIRFNAIGMPQVDRNDIIPVGTLRPTFVWQAFPRERDLKADKEGILSRTAAVKYDMRIWKIGKREIELVHEKRNFSAGEGSRERVVRPIKYSADGSAKELPSMTIKERVAEQTLDAPLELDTTYFWTVRAIFTLDGQKRLTPWSSISVNPDLCDDNKYAKHRFFFKTPSAAATQ